MKTKKKFSISGGNTIALAALLMLTTQAAWAGIVFQNTDFSASQSLWGGGASAGFDVSGSVGPTAVGVEYSVKSNSGTVNAQFNGGIRVNHVDSVNVGEQAAIILDFVGDSNGGFLNSIFGAKATAGGYFDICVIPNIFTGGCVTRVNPEFDLIDAGFAVEPETIFTPELDTKRNANDSDELAGVGSVDLIIGEVGPKLSLDIIQATSLKVSSIDGTLQGRHRDTGATFSKALKIDTNGGLDIQTNSLSLSGLWDFDLVDLTLTNTFTNDIDLGFRPTFEYIVGSWPNSPLAKVGLIDETFSLGFNSNTYSNAFSINAIAPVPPVTSVPAPASIALFSLGLVVLIRRGRKSPANNSFTI